jgi:hypothetical protein
MNRYFHAALLGVFSLLGASACQAQATFTVHLDTSSLIGNPNGPFSRDFQLSDGSGTNDGNNTATLGNFTFGTGAATGTATAGGGGAGSLVSGITLTDTGFVNELFQSFTPGNALTFNVALTGNADAGPTPDEFSFAVLDSSLAEIPTTGTGALLIADITPLGIAPQTFAGTGPYAALSAPTTAAAVPELGTRPLFGLGLAAGLFGLCRRTRKAAPPCA